jgi:hypothetical protein
MFIPDPRSKIFHPESRIQGQNDSGSWIPYPDLIFYPIPDPGVKKSPDPGSGSATLPLTDDICKENKQTKLSEINFETKTTLEKRIQHSPEYRNIYRYKGEDKDNKTQTAQVKRNRIYILDESYGSKCFHVIIIYSAALHKHVSAILNDSLPVNIC